MAFRDIKAGGAYVELMLKDKKFRDGLKSAGVRMAKFAKAAAVAGAAVATAAAGGIAVGIRQYIKMGDELDKMSKRTGVSVEALSELKHAAGQSGAGVADLEKGFAGLSRSMFDAARGSREANAALAAAGLTMRDLQGLNPEEQMAKVADGLQAIADESTKGAVAQRIFGRAGRQLLPMLRDGSKGMQQLRDEASNLGITMSTDAAAGAARLLDAFSIIASQLQAVGFNLGAAFAPLVEQALPAIQNFATVSIEYIQAAGQFMQDHMNAATSTMVNGWQSIYELTAPIIGGYVLTALDVFTGLYEILSSVFSGIANVVGSAWTYVGGETGNAMQFLQETVLGTLNTVSFAFRNWRRIAETAVAGAAYGLVRFGNQAAYIFGEVIPKWLRWFGDNWREIFTDVANITATVAVNIWENLKSLWDAIVGLFNGDGFQFTWTPLTEGFKSAIKELPQIAEREMGPVEQALKKRLDDLAQTLVDDYQASGAEFAQRSKAFQPPDWLKLFEGGGVAGTGGKGEGAGLPELPNLGGARKEVFGAFSAAAAAARGFGSKDKTTDKLEEIDRRDEKRFRRLEKAINEGAVLA